MLPPSPPRHDKTPEQPASNSSAVTAATATSRTCPLPYTPEQLGRVVDALSPSLRHDPTATLGLGDQLVLALAARYIESHQGDETVKGARHTLRDAARLLIAVGELRTRLGGPSRVPSLLEILDPAFFQLIVEAALQMSRYDPTTGEFGVIGMAKRIKAMLDLAQKIRLVGVITLRHQLLPEEMARIRRDVSDFREVMSLNWEAAISNRARLCEARRWHNRALEGLPDQGDVDAVTARALEQVEEARRRLAVG